MCYYQGTTTTTDFNTKKLLSIFVQQSSEKNTNNTKPFICLSVCVWSIFNETKIKRNCLGELKQLLSQKITISMFKYKKRNECHLDSHPVGFPQRLDSLFPISLLNFINLFANQTMTIANQFQINHSNPVFQQTEIPVSYEY